MSSKRFGMMIYVIHPRAASKKDKGTWDVYEEVYIRNGLKQNLMSQSSVVLDCATMEVYKDRTDSKRNFDEYIDYLAKSHQQVAEYKDLYDQYKKAILNMESEMRGKQEVDVQGTGKDEVTEQRED